MDLEFWNLECRAIHFASFGSGFLQFCDFGLWNSAFLELGCLELGILEFRILNFGFGISEF